MDILSFPVGKTYELVTTTLIHAHPIKRGFPKEASKYINLRAKGGYINAIYEVVDIIEGQPNDVLKGCSKFSTDVQYRLKKYIESRRESFGFSSEGRYNYRFYILKLHMPIEPVYQQIPNHMSYTYMTFATLLGKSKSFESERKSNKEENCPGVWIITANGKMYDHASSFATNGFIDWRQKASYRIGDIVFIYCTRPLMRIMFKCEVIQHSMQFAQCVDDSKFWIDKDEYEKSKKGLYARLKLLEQVDTPMLNLAALQRHGLSGHPQGPRGVSSSLYSYIDSHFNDYYSEGIFTDVTDYEEYHEGHVRSVMVNIYERSSIARSKCIEHHRCRCAICDLSFEEKYGELGRDFIHVHHLKPLHTIGKDYVVNYKTDLIPVCPNCHAMIHRIPGGEFMDVDEIQKALSLNSSEAKNYSRNGTSRLTSVYSKKAPTKETVSQKDTATPNKNVAIKYVGQRVFHTNSKFGEGVIVGESETTVKIRFDNGISTGFTKETFLKGLLKFIE